MKYEVYELHDTFIRKVMSGFGRIPIVKYWRIGNKIPKWKEFKVRYKIKASLLGNYNIISFQLKKEMFLVTEKIHSTLTKELNTWFWYTRPTIIFFPRAIQFFLVVLKKIVLQFNVRRVIIIMCLFSKKPFVVQLRRISFITIVHF